VGFAGVSAFATARPARLKARVRTRDFWIMGRTPWKVGRRAEWRGDRARLEGSGG